MVGSGMSSLGTSSSGFIAGGRGNVRRSVSGADWQSAAASQYQEFAHSGEMQSESKWRIPNHFI